MNTPLKYLTAAVVVAIVVIGILSYYQPAGPERSPSPTASVPGSPRACTLEAKLCPDGSSVGRVGPNCEFAPCPTTRTTIPPAPTATYTPSGY